MGRGMLLGMIDPAWIGIAAIVVVFAFAVSHLQASREGAYPVVTSASLTTCGDQGVDPGGRLGECFSGHSLRLVSRERRELLLDDPCFSWGDIKSSNGLATTVTEEHVTTGAGCGGTWRRVQAVLTGIFRGRATVSADGRNLRTGRTERFVITVQVR